MTATYWDGSVDETRRADLNATNEGSSPRKLCLKNEPSPQSMVRIYIHLSTRILFFKKNKTSFVVCFVGCEQKKRGTTTISISVNLFFRGEQTSCACALRGAFVPCHVTPNLTDIMSAESS